MEQVSPLGRVLRHRSLSELGPAQNKVDLMLFVSNLFRNQKALITEGLHHGTVRILLLEPVFKSLTIHIYAEPIGGELPAVFPLAKTDGFGIGNLDEKINLDRLDAIGDMKVLTFLDLIPKISKSLLQQVFVGKGNFHDGNMGHNQYVRSQNQLRSSFWLLPANS